MRTKHRQTLFESSWFASSVPPGMYGHRSAPDAVLTLDGCLPNGELGTQLLSSAPNAQAASAPGPEVPATEGSCLKEGSTLRSATDVVRRGAPFSFEGLSDDLDCIPTLQLHEGASSLEGCIPSRASSTLSSRCAPITLPQAGSHFPPPTRASFVASAANFFPAELGKSRPKQLVIPAGRAPLTLVHAGSRTTSAPQLDASSSAGARTRMSTQAQAFTCLPFTSFDSVNGPKSLVGQTDWQEQDFILRAIEASGLPGTPVGRILRYPVKDFACPQVVLLRGGPPYGRRAVAIDSRFIGGDVFVVEVFPRTIAIEIVRALASQQSLGALLDAIRAEAIRVCVNGIPTELNEQVLPNADVLDFCEGGVPDSAIPQEAASAATTEPFDVVLENRPATPPVPTSSSLAVVRRWKRQGASSVAEQAAEVNQVRTRFQSKGLQRCTIYDPLRQVEIVHSSACEEPFRFLSWAIERARHLGRHVDGRVLNHGIAGFPAPQICIHPNLRADYVALPVEVSPGIVCTVVASREASALSLMEQLERDCSVTRMQRLLLTRGVVRMAINGITVEDIHQRDALIVADSARITPHYVLLEHGVVPEVELLEPHWRSATGPLVLHRPGLAPVEVSLPAHFSPTEVRQALIHMGFLDNAGSIHLPYVCPAVPGIGLHLLLLNRQQVESETTFAVHDVRRVVHPPFVQYWTAPTVHQAHLDFMTEVLHDAFTVLGPIIEVFYDTRPLHQALEHRGCPWLTVMGFPRTTSANTPVLEPALLPSAEMSRLRPGYRAAYSRFRRALGSSLGVTGRQASYASSGTTADNLTCPAGIEATSTTTTTLKPEEPLDASESSTSTTTTSVQGAHLAVVGPNSWQSCDIVFHMMGEHAATACTTQRGRGHLAEILTTATWCLHSHDVLAANCVLAACPRGFFSPDGRCHVFLTAGGSGADRFLWVFAPEWRPNPFAILWSEQLEFPDVLDAVGIGADDVAIISVDGVLRCQHPALARPGSVVCVSSSWQGHFTIPLHLLAERVMGIQSLIFRAAGPGDTSLCSRRQLSMFFHELVQEASRVVGEHRQGSRFVIARAGATPVLCCAGTPLPPTVQQAQRYYDEFLLPHFGALCLKDTAQVHYDLTYFVGRYEAGEHRLWFLPFEGGADTHLGDVEGLSLREVPAPRGYRIEPSLCSGWCGLARMQPDVRPSEPPVFEYLVRLPPGFSSSSDDSPSLVRDCRDLTPEEASIISGWERRNRAIASGLPEPLQSEEGGETGAASSDDIVCEVPSSASDNSQGTLDSSSSSSTDSDETSSLQLLPAKPLGGVAIRRLEMQSKKPDLLRWVRLPA